MRRENDPHGSLLDGHIPFVAGDVPIEFVVILENFSPFLTRYFKTNVRVASVAPGIQIFKFR